MLTQKKQPAGDLRHSSVGSPVSADHICYTSSYKEMVSQHGLDGQFRRLRNVMMIDPLGYIDFVRLVKHARFVLTDSGGIQEETTV